MRRFARLSSQLIFWFLCISLVPLEVESWMRLRAAEDELRRVTMASLHAIAERQSDLIGAFVDQHWRNVSALAGAYLIQEAIVSYTAAFPSGVDSPAYRAADARFRPFIAELRHAIGFRDLYLISRAGTVVFSIDRRRDFGTNLVTGPLRDSPFGQVFDRTSTLLLAEFSDYGPYEVMDQPAAFVAAPVARDATLHGVVAVLLDEREILGIIDDYTGLGATGETELVELRGDHALYAGPLRHDATAAFTRRVPIGGAIGAATQAAARGYRGQGVDTDYRRQEVLAVWRYLPALSAGLVVKIDTGEAFASIAALRRQSLILAAMATPLIILAAVLVARSISAPLGALQAETGRIAAGDLTRRVRVTARNEIGTLAAAFNTMTGQLADSITRLTETTRAKERIESELAVAHDIQIGILPRVFPPFPNRTEFDLHARLIPAREIGGDFYDFVLINERELFVVVGDVSGKGVPGALFMAVTRTMFRSTVEPGIAPGAILAKMNRDLCLDNGPGLFVTLFCARLDIHTGELAYSNGGHNPPCLIHDGGRVSLIPSQGSLVLAMMEEADYRTDTLHLAPGDIVLLYTDGVTEAENRQQQLFGDDRLVRTIGRFHGADPVLLTRTLALEVKLFARGAAQNDDITLLALRFGGPGQA